MTHRDDMIVFNERVSQHQCVFVCYILCFEDDNDNDDDTSFTYHTHHSITPQLYQFSSLFL